MYEENDYIQEYEDEYEDDETHDELNRIMFEKKYNFLMEAKNIDSLIFNYVYFEMI